MTIKNHVRTLSTSDKALHGGNKRHIKQINWFCIYILETCNNKITLTLKNKSILSDKYRLFSVYSFFPRISVFFLYKKETPHIEHKSLGSCRTYILYIIVENSILKYNIFSIHINIFKNLFNTTLIYRASSKITI